MKRASDIHWQARSMGPKTGRGTARKGKIISAPPGKQNSDTLIAQHVTYSLFMRCQIKLCELNTPQAQIKHHASY